MTEQCEICTKYTKEFIEFESSSYNILHYAAFRKVCVLNVYGRLILSTNTNRAQNKTIFTLHYSYELLV